MHRKLEGKKGKIVRYDHNRYITILGGVLRHPIFFADVSESSTRDSYPIFLRFLRGFEEGFGTGEIADENLRRIN